MGKNRFTESYHAPDKTIQAVNESDLKHKEHQTKSHNVARTAVASQVRMHQVHPMLWQWLRENGPLAKNGSIDRSVISFESDYHVTPDSQTIDSVIIYATPEQKQAAEKP